MATAPMKTAEEVPFEVQLDPTWEEHLVALLRESEAHESAQSVEHTRRDANKLNALWVSLAKLGFQQTDIEACLTCPTCNSLQAALDWLCIHIDRENIPLEVRGSAPAPPPAEPEPTSADTLTFVSNEPRRQNAEPDSGDAKKQQPEPVITETPAPPQSSDASPSPSPTSPETCVEDSDKGSQKAWIQQYMENEEAEEEGAEEDGVKTVGNANRNLNTKLLREAQRLEEEYKAELQRAMDLKERSSPLLGHSIKTLKQMEAEAKRLTQQYTGKPPLQLCPLFRANRTEVQRLSDFAQQHKVDSTGTTSSSTHQFLLDPALAKEATKAAPKVEVNKKGDKKDKKKKEKEEPVKPMKAGSKEGLTPAQAAEQSVDRRNDANWSGKSSLEHLREYCRKNHYAKPMFEQMAAQPGDGTRVRQRLVMQKENDRKSREEYVLDEAFENVDQGKETLSTLALYRLISTSKPFYRQLPPKYRDLWLRWMKDEEDEESLEQAKQEKHRLAFIQRLLAENERHLATAERPQGKEKGKRTRKTLQPDDCDVPPEQATDAIHWDANTAIHGIEAAPVDDWEEAAGSPGGNDECVMDSWEDFDEEAEVDPGAAPDTAPTAPDQSEEQLQHSQRLLQDLQGREANADWLAMRQHQRSLPMFTERDNLLELLQSNQVVVISGQTGCGKTTQVPQYLIEDMVRRGRGSLCNIICTQPRRISAISVAERVREELGAGGDGILPHMVGYQVRLQRSISEETQVLFCTTGILLRRLQNDPTLQGVTHVIVDEVHEMTVQSDFLLIILRNILSQNRNLKVLLMSATINAARFSSYFGGCATLAVEGRLFPVQDFYLEDVIEACSYSVDPNGPYVNRKCIGTELPDHLKLLKGAYKQSTIETLHIVDASRVNYELIELLLVHAQATHPSDGAILVFLPGLGEIQVMYDQLMDSPYGFGNPMKYVIITLHSLLSPQEQCLVFRPPLPGIRKLVLATNVAETSITIPDVTVVIDTGRMKEVRYSPTNSISTLTECWVSRANAQQRRGRAGRVRCGVAYHLFPRHIYETEMEAYQQPEILRVPLDDLCLQIKILGLGSCANFLANAVQPPAPEAVAKALQTLVGINALDEEENLTPLGYHLASLPVDVHVGKMLLYSAIFKCVDPITTIAAFMSLRSPFVQSVSRRAESQASYRRFAAHQSDHLTLLEVYRQWQSLKGQDRSEKDFCKQNFLSLRTLQSIQLLKKQLWDNLADIGFTSLDCDANAMNVAVLKGVVCAGLYPNVMKVTVTTAPRQGTIFRFTAGSNEEVFIHPSSINATAKQYNSSWFVYYEKVRSHQVFIRDCTTISPQSLIMFGNPPEVMSRDGVITVPGVYRISAPILTAVLLSHFQRRLEEVIFARMEHQSDKRKTWPDWHAECLAMAQRLMTL